MSHQTHAAGPDHRIVTVFVFRDQDSATMHDTAIQCPINGCYPDSPRPAVGAVVFKDRTVLLVKRGKPPASGVWAIPGGSVQLGETLQAAAEREILEETGITIKAGAPVFVFDVIEHDDIGRVRYHYVIVDLAATYVTGEPHAGDDAADARWIKEEALPDLCVNPATRRLLADVFAFGR